jgi:hypothetical protein
MLAIFRSTIPFEKGLYSGTNRQTSFHLERFAIRLNNGSLSERMQSGHLKYWNHRSSTASTDLASLERTAVAQMNLEKWSTPTSTKAILPTHLP